jgi:hypothetical protein
MSDKFDAYREALVMETKTVWPDDGPEVSPSQRPQIEHRLHADAENCSDIEYVRMHTGFCRVVTVTPDDIDRVSGD